MLFELVIGQMTPCLCPRWLICRTVGIKQPFTIGPGFVAHTVCQQAAEVSMRKSLNTYSWTSSRCSVLSKTKGFGSGLIHPYHFKTFCPQW